MEEEREHQILHIVADEGDVSHKQQFSEKLHDNGESFAVNGIGKNYLSNDVTLAGSSGTVGVDVDREGAVEKDSKATNQPNDALNFKREIKVLDSVNGLKSNIEGGHTAIASHQGAANDADSDTEVHANSSSDAIRNRNGNGNTNSTNITPVPPDHDSTDGAPENAETNACTISASKNQIDYQTNKYCHPKSNSAAIRNTNDNEKMPLNSFQPKGPHLLLASMAGMSSAIGITLTRWIVSETGEVLVLLFSSNTSTNHGSNQFGSTDQSQSMMPNDFDFMEGVDTDLFVDNANVNIGGSLDENVGAMVGRVLVALSSSPHLRSAPLFLLFISSTAFVVGVFLTGKELQSCFQLYHQRWRVGLGQLEKWKKEGLTQINLLLNRKNETGNNMENDSKKDASAKEKGIVTSAGDLSSLLRAKQSQFKLLLSNQLESAIQFMDGMIIDDVLRKFMKNWNEFMMGIGGGVVLYSIPEEIFPCMESSTFKNEGGKNVQVNQGYSVLSNTSKMASVKNVRRRLVHAADPSLDQLLFQAGGVWNVLPSGFRDSLISTLGSQGGAESKYEDKAGGNNVTEDEIYEVTSNSTEEEEASSDVSPVAASPENILAKHSLINGDWHDAEKAAFATDVVAIPVDLSRKESKKDLSRNGISKGHSTVPMCITSNSRVGNTDDDWTCSRETISDVVTSTMNDLILSNLSAAFKGKQNQLLRKEELNAAKEHNHHSRTDTFSLDCGHQDKNSKHNSTSPVPPSNPQTQIATYLRRTTVVATFFFFCHLRGSRTTRKTWWSALQFSASLGLVGTALGTGAASMILGTSRSLDTVADGNPVVGLLCSKMLEFIESSSAFNETPSNAVNKIGVIFKRLRTEFEGNKRLKAALAVLVLYGIKRMPKRMNRRKGFLIGGRY